MNHANNRTSITYDNFDVMTFGYDARSQLISESRTGIVSYTETLTYDPAGNRTQRTRIIPYLAHGTYPTYYSYNSANQLTSETTNGIPTIYSYDANGNMTGKATGGPFPETWSYSYDYGRL